MSGRDLAYRDGEALPSESGLYSFASRRTKRHRACTGPGCPHAERVLLDLTPTIILWILENISDIEVLTYLDADLCFFSSPDPIFDELGHNNVLIHEYRFAPALSHLEKENGKYNVGLLCFRNNEQSRSVLQWWRERCLERCYRRFEDGKMGDQMYLNYWVTRFRNVAVLQNIGAGVAP